MLEKERFLHIQGCYYDAFHSRTHLDSRVLAHSEHRIPGIETASFHLFALNTGLDNHVTNILNGINRFVFLIIKLRAWNVVHESLDDEREKQDIMFDQIMPVASEALARPYSIKSSLLFSTVEIFLILYRIHGLAEPKIDLYRLRHANLDLFAPLSERVGISTLTDFRTNLDGIDAKEYRTATNNFRNRAHHGLEPYIGIGEMPLLQFWKDDEAQGYSIGSEKALSVEELFPILENEHSKCVVAFKSFWALIAQILEKLPEGKGLDGFRMSSNRVLPENDE